MVKPIPEGFHSVTPHLAIDGAAAAIDFYKKAFGAVELGRMPAQDGKRLMHAMIRIGDSVIMLADAFPEYGGQGPKALGGTPVTVHLYVPDSDKVFAQAVAAGAKVAMPIADMFWGDRYGQLVDPFGHHWSIAEHLEDLTPAQMEERKLAAFAGAGCGAE
jgi:PhnB protein